MNDVKNILENDENVLVLSHFFEVIQGNVNDGMYHQLYLNDGELTYDVSSSSGISHGEFHLIQEVVGYSEDEEQQDDGGTGYDFWMEEIERRIKNVLEDKLDQSIFDDSYYELL